MKKKFVCVILGLCIALGLTACDNGSKKVPLPDSLTPSTVYLTTDTTLIVTMPKIEGIGFTFNGKPAAAKYSGDSYTLTVDSITSYASSLKITADGYDAYSTTVSPIQGTEGVTFAEADTIETAINDSPNAIVIAPSATIEKDITIEKTVKLLGQNGTVFTGRINVTADDVFFNGVSIEHTYADSNPGSGNPVDQGGTRLRITGTNFTITDSKVKRTTDFGSPYGWILDYAAEKGVLKAVNTQFIAPYNVDYASQNSPSVINSCKAEIDLYGCSIETNGYAFFSQWVTKGKIENTVISSYGSQPDTGLLSAINSMNLEGLTFKGCTFSGNRSNCMILAGSFTIDGCTFTSPTVKTTDATPENKGKLYIAIYYNDDVKIINNTFELTDKDGNAHYGIRLQNADWANGEKHPELIDISGNVFNGKGFYAVRNGFQSWHDAGTLTIGENALNGNKIINEVE